MTDLLSFSADYGDDESYISEQAEATLRSHYSRNTPVSQTHSSSQHASTSYHQRPLAVLPQHPAAPHPPTRDTDSLSVRMPSAVPFNQPKKRGRPLGSKNKPKPPPVAIPPPTASTLGIKRSADDGTIESEAKRHHAQGHPTPPEGSFVMPPVVTKGAYRLNPSEEVSRSLKNLGITNPRDQQEIVAVVERNMPELVAEASGDEDSASFTRRYAVQPSSMYEDGDCPICEETQAFSFHHANKSMGAGVSSTERSSNSAQRHKERMTRAIQARANLSESDQNCHQVIYEIERRLRVRISDKRIFKIMLVLRREWIEKRLEYFQIPYVPWTRKMLEAHYDPRNKHFRQPARDIARHYDQANDILELLHRTTVNTDTLDFRGVDGWCKVTDRVTKLREELKQQLEEESPDNAEDLRMLMMAIARTTRDEGALKLLQDTNTAAGKAKAVADKDPHGSYIMQHLSAQ